ncbi:MAG: prepilin peptidase [Alphaproteobacteria bacterium]|uniref:Prepilin leader peptidase/N-methyltransferase n=1 Tax=Candidatus Nitrobium versatile TaxID=2884831 RepID=A0A953J8P9_9BACT|nr:prepilin peptidase [Candidatus Nitrobium versatile]
MYPAVFAFFFGLIVGSFLNVCIYRLPRDISIVSPPSACPRCHTSIKPWENIPLVSYLFLRGRCRTCGERISLRYPLVELGNGLLYGAVFTVFGTGWHLPLLFVLVSAMLVITFIDLDFQIIPDMITLPGILIGLISASFILPDPFGRTSAGPADPVFIVGFTNSLAGLIAGGGLFYFIAVASRGGMGGGDIKMMAMVGAFMGWKSVLLTTFIGSLAGSVVGIFLMLFRGKGRKARIPFGPFLAFGSLVSLFFGGLILEWYFTR